MYKITGCEEGTSELHIADLHIEDIEMVAEVCKLFEKERGGKVRYSYAEDTPQNFIKLRRCVQLKTAARHNAGFTC